ncbi:MAG TPA: DUF5665 domain-containing protein [Patescibacteria group bacterium]|nr:DUF5665 domain-containing protein [Patescibacteria group bacterium]
MINKYQNAESSMGRIFRNNFMGGIAWGIGATIGMSLLFAILGLILSTKLDFIPVVGTFVTDVTKFVLENLQTKPLLIK